MPDTPPEQDAWGHCAHGVCCCPNGADGPDQLCSHCRVGLCSTGELSALRHLSEDFLVRLRNRSIQEKPDD